MHKIHPKPLLLMAVVIAFIQFTSALEYMMLNPVFAFMAADFAVPVSFSGYVSGIYTLGAVLSGVTAFCWIDRCNKTHFLVANMGLLGLLTLLATFTDSFSLLLLFRFCAGLAGGTTMGVGISLLINNAPVELRGKMLATVIASFSLVSIVGMPTLLFLCAHYGWHVAFWLVSLLCLLSVPMMSVVPSDTATETVSHNAFPDAETLLFASGNALAQFSPMLIIPVLVPLMIQQMGASPDLLSGLFFIGGVAGYVATKLTGALTSRFSALFLATGSTSIFLVSLLVPVLHCQHAMLFVTLFLGASYSRLVSCSVVTVQFPDNRQRAGFFSLQTSLLYLVTTVAFFLSASLLTDNGITAQNVATLLGVCAISACGLPILIIILQKKLTRRALRSGHLTPAQHNVHGSDPRG